MKVPRYAIALAIIAAIVVIGTIVYVLLNFPLGPSLQAARQPASTIALVTATATPTITAVAEIAIEFPFDEMTEQGRESGPVHFPNQRG